MRVGKIHTYAGASSINSSTSIVPIPDNSNYTTVFKSSHTGYYYERLSTGQIIKITCCQDQLSYLGNVSQVGIIAPTLNELDNDFATANAAYVGVGIYDITFANANFAVGTTTVEIQQPPASVGFASAAIQTPSSIRIRTFDNTFVAADAILTDQALRITRQD